MVERIRQKKSVVGKKGAVNERPAPEGFLSLICNADISGVLFHPSINTVNRTMFMGMELLYTNVTVTKGFDLELHQGMIKK